MTLNINVGSSSKGSCAPALMANSAQSFLLDAAGPAVVEETMSILKTSKHLEGSSMCAMASAADPRP